MSPPRVWFITGTSTGLGRALAELILEQGEVVVGTARTPSALDDLAGRYPSDRLLVLKLDVTVQQHISDAFTQAKASFGRVDIVVNNAGYGDLGEMESVDDADARAIFDTNFWGATSVTRAAVKFFREANPPGLGGRLLQISSVLGVVGTPAYAFYTASKFALEGMTESLVQELDPKWNIQVTLIEPGWIKSAYFGKATWSVQHPAYASADLPVTKIRAEWDDFVPRGDTRKAVELFYRVAALPNPPLHFPVGVDAVALINKKLDAMKDIMHRYGSWSEGLDSVNE
ncbi:NAD-P-binding protein [Trametes elegans]|nr:NAD-P-binding protein [Trametes elegans]